MNPVERKNILKQMKQYFFSCGLSSKISNNGQDNIHVF